MKTRHRSSNIAKSSKRFTSIRKAKKAFKQCKGLSNRQKVSKFFVVDLTINNQYLGSFDQTPFKLIFRVYFQIND